VSCGTPGATRGGANLVFGPGLRFCAAGHGNSAPTLVWQVVRLGAGWEVTVGDHDVSGTGRQRGGLAITSTTSMLPRWQCGQIRKDKPVSASFWSR